jgi:hypothetical protein
MVYKDNRNVSFVGALLKNVLFGVLGDKREYAE